MFPLDLPARDVLRLPGQTEIQWAVFDAEWYRRACPDAPQDDPQALLAWHLDVGQRRGNSPNRLFDEAWHRARYPAIARRIAEGEFASAFDAYCRRGALDRSPTWLFDELAYRDSYPDLTNEVLAAAGLANGYDHYLRHGIHEDRSGHKLFDVPVYLANFDPSDAQSIRAAGAFHHYLARIEDRAPELRTSLYFDPDWYLRRYPEVAQEIAAGRWSCALHHYLCNDRPTAFDPNDSFSEEFYLRRDPGLVQVIQAGHFRNGYAHFLRFGVQERRQPRAGFDLAWYARQPAVEADIAAGRAADAFAHWLAIGRSAGLPPAPPKEADLTDAQARLAFVRAADAWLPAAGRHGLDFTCTNPVASVVMCVRDGFALTMAALSALRAGAAAEIELVIIDRGSSDETAAITRYVHGARVERFQDDVGWAPAADIGRQMARAPYVLFLAQDARLAPGALDRAIRRLEDTPGAGAVGGMIVRPSGLIGQAGGILWRDGGRHDYQRGASPLAPEANFLRQVDFCCPAFLLVPSGLLSHLKGLDAASGPGYEAVDLCLRITEAGFAVLYDPSIVIFHDDQDDPTGEPSPRFLARHAAALASRHQRGGSIQAFARHAGPAPHRILFLEDTIPLRRTGSGFVRSNDIVQVMARLGYAVTVYPVNGCTHDPAHAFADMPDKVEAMHTHALPRLKEFLEGRPLYYDTVWVARTHNLDRVQPILSHLQASGALKARIILDTEAVTPMREAQQAALMDQAYDLPAAMRAFTAGALSCDTVLAVTEAEAASLRQHGLPRVMTLGHMIAPKPTQRPFGKRTGMLFVGAIHKPDSPNYDSLIWFVDRVLPLIEARLGWETRLTIAGYVAPGVDMSRFEHHPRISLRGPVAELTPLYDSHRIFVAPTRFAAGAPYKVLEAAAHGLPVVATGLLATELDWQDREQALRVPVGDAEGFADAAVALYRDESLWTHIREQAIARLLADHATETFAAALAAILMPVAGQAEPADGTHT